MDKKGLTKKQFQIQMIPAVIYILLAAFWIVTGILEGEILKWILGSVFLVLSILMAISLFVQRKRYPLEDAQLDEQVVRNFNSPCVRTCRHPYVKPFG